MGRRSSRRVPLPVSRAPRCRHRRRRPDRPARGPERSRPRSPGPITETPAPTSDSPATTPGPDATPRKPQVTSLKAPRTARPARQRTEPTRRATSTSAGRRPGRPASACRSILHRPQLPTTTRTPTIRRPGPPICRSPATRRTTTPTGDYHLYVLTTIHASGYYSYRYAKGLPGHLRRRGTWLRGWASIGRLPHAPRSQMRPLPIHWPIVALATTMLAACGGSTPSPSPEPPAPGDARALLRVTFEQAIHSTVRLAASHRHHARWAGPVRRRRPGDLPRSPRQPIVERRLSPAGWAKIVAVARDAGLLSGATDFTGGELAPGSDGRADRARRGRAHVRAHR